MAAKWRILEFYSGIGAMRYSLMKAGVDGEVIEAFDINDTANDVYEHNFHHRPFQGNIQNITAFELDKYSANAWLLSPPCQPYTRQGLQKHSADARAFSFIKILELIPLMMQPPQVLFVENVVGFETSDTHENMVEIFRKSGFVTQEYILTPLQFGIPYSRPRYFCLAKRVPLSFCKPSYNNKLIMTPNPLNVSVNTESVGDVLQDYELEESYISCQPIRNFLDKETSFSRHGGLSSTNGSNVSAVGLLDDLDNTFNEGCAVEVMENTSIALEQADANESYLDIYSVPSSLVDRWGSAMDIVFPDSKRCCCFTKSYYRYVKGTGSLLATCQISQYASLKKPDLCLLKDLKLRYFTPREVANLHSFPKDFNFPPHISIRQQYALLGNSMSVEVVACLFRYMFAQPSWQ